MRFPSMRKFVFHYNLKILKIKLLAKQALSVQNPPPPEAAGPGDVPQADGEAAADELRDTFCPELACYAYVSLTRIMGGNHMKEILGEKHETVWQLSSSVESSLTKHYDDRSEQVKEIVYSFSF